VKLTLLGTGMPWPNPLRAGPSQHLQLGDTSVVVDCGNGAARRMVEAGIDYNVDYVFITHMHSDHTIDLAHLLISGWIQYRKKPWRIVGPSNTQEFVNRLLHAFEEDIRIRRLYDRVGAEVMTPIVQEVQHGDVIEGDGWRSTAIEVEHGYVKPALGFRFDGDGRKLVISGDTAPCDALVEASGDADVLVHEMTAGLPDQCDKHGPSSKDLNEFRQRIAASHTCSHEVGKVAADAGARHLVLSHLSPRLDEAAARGVIEQDYGGQVTFGYDLLTL
jgi:ribonuclease BN (tRNA processing enzyme)